MTASSCDGPGLLAAFRAGVANLEAHVEYVNSMNVFPVPDGDTGTNMVATARAALLEAEGVVHAEAAPLAAAISRGALYGAQGNSGVIASQIARGMAEAMAGRKRIDGHDLARAFARGAETAYAAVLEPVEGTMLTVIRDAAAAADLAARNSDDARVVLRDAVVAAEASVARTPELLTVLLEAGVPDAGGEGIYLLLAGALASAEGVAPRRRRPATVPRPAVPSHATDRFGFETLFRLDAGPAGTLDIDAIRAHLGSIGHSVVVAGDARAVTVHVHGAVPDAVLAYAEGLGAVSRVSVEDLDRQADAFEHEPAAARVRRGAGLTVVAVVDGDGFATLFESLGATVLDADGGARDGGVDGLSEAIAGAGGDVLVLATDPSIQPRAEQAARRSDRRVLVVPTRNAAEAASALLALDGTLEPTVVAAAMTSAAGRVQTIAVADGHDAAAALEGIRGLAPGFELLTIYTGLAADSASAQDIGRSISALLPDVEVEIVRGGQRDSLYLIAAE